MPRALVLWLSVATTAACSDVPATNPFDPRTPPSQQQPGSIAGSLTLPARFGAERYSEARVRLVAAAPDGPAGEETPDERGAFRFEPLTAGSYLVQAEMAGFEADPVIVELAVGEARALDLIALRLRPEADPAEPCTVVVGRVELQGAEPLGHGGTTVEMAHTPFVTQTVQDGAFRLAVVPGAVKLRI